LRHINLVTPTQQTARRNVSRPLSLSNEDVKDPDKLAELLKQAYLRITDLEARIGPEPLEFETNVQNGGTVRLAHNLNCPVRYYVTHVDGQMGGIQPSAAPPRGWDLIQRVLDVTGGTICPAGNITTGTRWRMLQRKEILGIRFFWRAAAVTANRTIRCVLWNDTTGAVIAEKNVSVVSGAEWGSYDAIFDTPVTTDLTGTNITASIYDLAGAVHTYTSDTIWVTQMAANPLRWSPDHRLIHMGLFSAGNARPATAFAAEFCAIELILGNNTATPQLVKDPSSDANNLVLKSYMTGKVVIRVEPVQAGLVK
jgi:hypothetical protein